uniref:Uncharacterized protein n=1 Tax=Caulerpa lentillifera TaxID=148947 RepID=A0A2Z2QKJ5_9CHLO|nr:hypothetical protein [Caulerpa lentillifera]AST24228.1 hypothetical protein [Caulerpa lentillifera]QKS32242.1 hypothetical protein [Caulerpa lentillifera]
MSSLINVYICHASIGTRYTLLFNLRAPTTIKSVINRRVKRGNSIAYKREFVGKSMHTAGVPFVCMPGVFPGLVLCDCWRFAFSCGRPPKAGRNVPFGGVAAHLRKGKLLLTPLRA